MARLSVVMKPWNEMPAPPSSSLANVNHECIALPGTRMPSVNPALIGKQLETVFAEMKNERKARRAELALKQDHDSVALRRKIKRLSVTS